jgi:hypothetical protein
MKASELLSSIENGKFTQDQYAVRPYNRIIPNDGTFEEYLTVDPYGTLWWFNPEDESLKQQVILDNEFLRSSWTIKDKNLSEHEKYLKGVIEQLDNKSIEILRSTIIALHYSNHRNCTDQLIAIFDKVTGAYGYYGVIGLEKVTKLMDMEVEVG